MKIKKIFLYVVTTTILLAIVFFLKSYLFTSDFIESNDNNQQEDVSIEASSYIIESHHGFITENGEIDIIDSNYMVALTEIFYNLDKYQGREIILDGFVYREDYYEDNQFMLARRVVSCCEEHAAMMGLICHWEDTAELEEDTWIRVKGMLQSTVHYSPENSKEATWPIIIVEEIEIVERPEKEYIQQEI